MKAKQLLALLLALLTVMSVFVSCGGDPVESQTPEDQETQGTDAPVVPETEVETELTHDLPEGINFKDVTNPKITFFTRTGYDGEIYAKEIVDEDINDAIYWRNQSVQEALGVEIASIAQGCGWGATGHYSEWNNTLRNAVQTTTHDFDAAMIYAGTGSSLAIEGCYMDLSKLDMLSLGKPWWNQSLLDVATVYGVLCFASGAIAYSQLAEADVLYFNKDLYNEFFAVTDTKDIYQVVRDGEWTIDYMHDLVSQVWVDADTNGEKSSGDTVGYVGAANGANGTMDGWFYALGCNLTTMDESIGEPVAAFYNEHTIQAYDKLSNLYTNNTGTWNLVDGGQSNVEIAFRNGEAMIMLGKFSSGSALRDVPFGFGVLPLPKFDIEQENYVAIPEVASSMVTVISTVEDERLDMVTATIELMAYESYKNVIPTYIDVILKSKQANSPDDAEMVQLVLDSMVYSFGWIFSSTHMADMGKAFRAMGRDITQYYEARKDRYNQYINDLIDGFASLS